MSNNHALPHVDLSQWAVCTNRRDRCHPAIGCDSSDNACCSPLHVSGKRQKVEVAGELRMKSRIEYGKIASEGRKAMFGLESYVRQCGLEVSLLELVRLRASQINGCAYCVDMHTKDARAEGETEQRLYALVAWEETPF